MRKEITLKTAPSDLKKGLPLPGNLKAVAFIHNEAADTTDLVVRFTNKHDEHVSLDVPLGLLGGSPQHLMRALSAASFPVPSDRKDRAQIFDYLNGAKPERRIFEAPQLGWQSSGVFLHGRKMIGNEDKIYRPSKDIAAEARAKFGIRGTVGGWNRHVAKHCVGNSRAMLAIATAFAAPLLGIMKSESIGFYFYGERRTGKTTLLKVAFSVCGGGDDPKIGYESGSLSLAAIGPLSLLYSDGLLCIDEMSQTDPASTGRLSHALGDQKRPRRATATGMLRPASETTRLMFLATGNDTAEAYGLRSSDPTGRAAAVRMIEIPATPPDGDGVFETVPKEFRDADRFPGLALSQHFNKTVTKQHGTPIRAFLRKLIALRVDDEEALEARIGKIQKGFRDLVIQGQDDYGLINVAERFGLALAGGQLAVEFGVLKWRVSDLERAVRTCFDAHIKHLEVSGKSAAPGAIVARPIDDDAIIEAVRAYLSKNEHLIPEITLQASPPPDVVRMAVGFRDLRHPNKPKLILKQLQLEDAVRQLFTPKQLVKALDNQKLLKLDPKGRKKWSTTIGNIRIEQSYFLSISLWPKTD